MLPMSPQQQFELAKEVAVSNPARLQAVLRGQPDPIFSDLNIAMMALRGAADLRRSVEGAQAAQQTQQPSVKDQMVAQMDQQFGGVANLQAPNMDIPGGGVAGEEEPPVVQAAGGGMIKRFNGETGSEVPESTIGRWWRTIIGDTPDAEAFRKRNFDTAELMRRRSEVIVNPWEAVTPSERARREREEQALNAQIRALQEGKTPDPSAAIFASESGAGRPSYAPGTGAATADPGYVPAAATPSPAMRAAQQAAPAARAVTAAPAAPGIAALATSPDAVADMVDYRGQGLPGAETGVAGARSVGSFLDELSRRRADAAKQMGEEVATERQAVIDAINRKEGKGEEYLAKQLKTHKGLAALAAAAELGKGGRSGMASIGAAFGAVGNVGAQLSKLQTATQKDIDKLDLIRADKALAFKEGDRKLAAELTLKESDIANKMLATEYDKIYRAALVRNQERGLDIREAKDKAEIEAERDVRPFRIALMQAQGTYYGRRAATAGGLTAKELTNLRARIAKDVLASTKSVLAQQELLKRYPGKSLAQARAAEEKALFDRSLLGYSGNTEASSSIQIPDSDIAGAGKFYDATKS